MQNKPNFMRFLPENNDFTKKQTQFKPNSNPIKANFGPKSRVQSQNKPKTNPICSGHFEPIYSGKNDFDRGDY